MQILYTEKYRPKNFNSLTFNRDVDKKLINLVQSENMPHMIFYGPHGGGKKTRINCILNEIYGEQALHVQKDVYRIKHRSKQYEVNIRYSKYHIEISPSDVNNMDQVLLTQFLKDTATN